MANNESVTKPADLVGMQSKYFVTGLKDLLWIKRRLAVTLGLLNA